MTGLHRERALKWADLLFKAVILGLLIALALLLPRQAKPAAASAPQEMNVMNVTATRSGAADSTILDLRRAA
jgi:hypothetical protein